MLQYPSLLLSFLASLFQSSFFFLISFSLIFILFFFLTYLLTYLLAFLSFYFSYLFTCLFFFLLFFLLSSSDAVHSGVCCSLLPVLYKNLTDGSRYRQTSCNCMCILICFTAEVNLSKKHLDVRYRGKKGGRKGDK